MLVELTITNFAIIDSLRLSLEPDPKKPSDRPASDPTVSDTPPENENT